MENYMQYICVECSHENIYASSECLESIECFST